MASEEEDDYLGLKPSEDDGDEDNEGASESESPSSGRRSNRGSGLDDNPKRNSGSSRGSKSSSRSRFSNDSSSSRDGRYVSDRRSGRRGKLSSADPIAMLEKVKAKLLKKERENAALMAKLKRMEKNLQSRKQHYGRNNVSRDTWDGSDLANLDNINRYCKEKLYPYYKFLPSEWNTFSPVDVGTICCKLIGVVDVPGNVTVEYYYSERVVPMVNKKYVEMRSNINGHIRKLYQSMSYILFDFRHTFSDLQLTDSVLSTLCSFYHRGS